MDLELVQVYEGGSDEWLWYQQDGAKYYFLRILDLVAYMGKDAQVYWEASVCLVDISDPGVLSSWHAAYASSGWDENYEPPSEANKAMILFEYGAKSPLWDGFGGDVPEDDWDKLDEDDEDFKKLFEQASQFISECLSDSDKLEEKLNTPVNALGQTAREYAHGTNGLFKRLTEIKDDPNATEQQKLVLRVYGRCDHTLGGDVIPEELKE